MYVIILDGMKVGCIGRNEFWRDRAVKNEGGKQCQSKAFTLSARKLLITLLGKLTVSMLHGVRDLMPNYD